MRKFLALPLLTGLLAAQMPPELVVSVGHSGAPDRAVFVGGYLATASSSNVAIIDLSNGLTTGHLPQGSLVLGLEASPADADLLAVGTCGHSILLWDVKSRTVRHSLDLPQECAEFLSFSPDGAFLATGAQRCCSRDGALQVWDIRNGNLTRELAKGSSMRNVAFSGDGRWVAGVDGKGKASLFEWPSGQLLREFDGLDHPGWSDSAIVASRDGKYFAWLGGGGLRVWDVSSGREIPLPGKRTVEVWDLPPDGPERRWTEERVAASAAEFLDDGRLAYVADDHLMLRVLPDGPQESAATAPA